MADSLFKRQNFQAQKTERVSREEMDLLVREQIGSLILIHAMTIHHDM